MRSIASGLGVTSSNRPGATAGTNADHPNAVAASGRWLFCRVGSRTCALPIGHVIETMRPLPVEPFVASSPAVVGIAVIRGSPTPVVDLGLSLGATCASSDDGRLVTVRVGSRTVALRVDGVVGVRDVPPGVLAPVPPLLAGVTTDVCAALGVLDDELLVLLESGRLVDDAVWDAIAERPVPA